MSTADAALKEDGSDLRHVSLSPNRLTQPSARHDQGTAFSEQCLVKLRRFRLSGNAGASNKVVLVHARQIGKPLEHVPV
jgi:hypothetical protein